MQTQVKPKFLIAAEELARKRNTSVEEILRIEPERSGYPGPECLLPDEIESVFCGVGMEPERAAHLASCRVCRSLVETARVDRVELGAVLALVKEREEAMTGAMESTDRQAVAGNRPWGRIAQWILTGLAAGIALFRYLHQRAQSLGGVGHARPEDEPEPVVKTVP